MSLLAVFVASLLGSPHCAGMCGGFVAFYSAKSGKKSSHFAYHLGRLLTYSILGALAGHLGKSVDSLANLSGAQSIIGAITGILLIYWGLRAFFGKELAGSNVSGSFFYSKLFALYKRTLGSSEQANWTQRAFTIGALSTFLPCGWLYAFVAVSAASGGAIAGAITMVVFWAGTVPILSTLGVSVRFVNSWFGSSVPRVSGVLLIFAGLLSIFTHFGLISIIDHGQHEEQSTYGKQMICGPSILVE